MFGPRCDGGRNGGLSPTRSPAGRSLFAGGPMLGKLKELFGPGGRVSLERRFSITCETPQGSMSRVYRAVDKESGRTVCLKIQHTEKHAAAESRASRLERPPEGEIAMKVVHPNVVRT